MVKVKSKTTFIFNSYFKILIIDLLKLYSIMYYLYFSSKSKKAENSFLNVLFCHTSHSFWNEYMRNLAYVKHLKLQIFK